MRTANGDFRPDTIEPMVISSATAKRYHVQAWDFACEGDVVMFTTGSRWIGGHEAGEHDGIRDGASYGRMDTRHNHVVYVPLADWLAAGYPRPE